MNFSLFFNALAFVLLVNAPKISCKLHFKTIMRGTVSSVHWLLTLLFCREMLLTHWVWAIESTLSTLPLSILRLWCRSQTKRSRLKISCLMESMHVYTSLLERTESWGDQLCSSMEVDGPWALQVCPRVSLWFIIFISWWSLLLYSLDYAWVVFSCDCFICRQHWGHMTVSADRWQLIWTQWLWRWSEYILSFEWEEKIHLWFWSVMLSVDFVQLSHGSWCALPSAVWRVCEGR